MSASDDAPLSDPHGELGVPRHASEGEIKSAWRRLAARWHPDRNPHPRAAERMQRINAAYRQLTGADDDAAPPPQADPPEPPARPRRAWWERNWAGARWEPDGAATPATIAVDVALALEQAAFGCAHVVKGSLTDLCDACAGVGRQVSQWTDCPACDGEGRVRSSDGARWSVCATCFGDGDARQPCDGCGGSGLAAEARSYHFEVRLPSGLRDGQTVVLRRQGQRGPQDRRGDLELRIRIEPHALFSFDAEQRLVCRLPVDGYAVAGEGSAQVPVLGGGTVAIELARGALQVLPGVGYPNRDGSRGPLVVETRAVTPRVHTERQRELLRCLADDLRDGGYAGSGELADWHDRLQRWPAVGSAAAAGAAEDRRTDG